MTDIAGSLEVVDELEEGDGEVRSALDWAQVRALAADGISQREIAARLGINRRTVGRLAQADEPPRYERAPRGSMLDPLEAVIARLIEQWPSIKAPRVAEVLRDDYGFTGSVDLVRRGMAALRPPQARPAQRTGYRPGQVAQFDWAEMPTRPTIAGRERRVYALICSLPYSGASTAHFSFDMTVESFLEGHVRAFEWLGGVPRECVYDNLRSAVARREGSEIHWSPRFLQLRGHYAFHATACTPATPREKGSVEGAVRHTKTGFWPARRFESFRARPPLRRLARPRRAGAPPRHGAVHRLRAPGRARGAALLAARRLRCRRAALFPRPAGRLLKHGASFYRAPQALVHQRVELCFDRDEVWICHRGEAVARYPRSYAAGTWQPAPRMRPEPPAAPAAVALAAPDVVPPALADYAGLSA